MAFQKGVSGNPKGRTKGKKSDKSDESIREFLRVQTSEYFYGTGEGSFIQDIKNSSPSMRLQMMEKYLKFFLAPMQQLKIDGNVDVNQNGVIRIDFGFNDNDVDNDIQNIISLI